MEQLSKYLPLLVVLALLCCVLLFLYSNSRLTEAIDRIETARGTIDSSIQALKLTRSMVDSVRRDLATFGSYVHDIQGRVEILDLNQRAEKGKFRNQQSAINGRLRTLYREVEVTGRDLPEIPVVQGSPTGASPPPH